MNNRPVILFDGVCNFCNSAVNFIIKRNTRSNILFAPMQTETGQKLLKQYDQPVEDMQSFIFIDYRVAYKK
jgi:predicted DCC family thiol-disulfide oxidoreductase YuxK